MSLMMIGSVIVWVLEVFATAGWRERPSIRRSLIAFADASTLSLRQCEVDTEDLQNAFRQSLRRLPPTCETMLR